MDLRRVSFRFLYGLIIISSCMLVWIYSHIEQSMPVHQDTRHQTALISVHKYSPANGRRAKIINGRRKRVHLKRRVMDLNASTYSFLVDHICELEVNTTSTMCSCNPVELNGELDVDMSELLSYNWSNLENIPDLDPGGHWAPSKCSPLRRVAILIPYRDRENHLVAFLAHTHPILQRQQVEYQIYVVEQRYPYIFNKGSVMNAGFQTIMSQPDFVPDCIVFHDVDMLMLNDQNIFICADHPMHMGAFVDKFNFTLLYDKMFGGAVAITPAQYQAVNGYSNMFPGWGGEDDDFYGRVVKVSGLYRAPRAIARYSMIKHKHDNFNPVNNVSMGVKTSVKIARRSLRSFRKHGLNTVQFKVISNQLLPYYTHILLDLTDDNDYHRLNFTRHTSTKCSNANIIEETTVSQVTCEALCYRNATSCLGYQYTSSSTGYSICQILSTICAHPISAENIDLFIKQT